MPLLIKFKKQELKRKNFNPESLNTRNKQLNNSWTIKPSMEKNACKPKEKQNAKNGFAFHWCASATNFTCVIAQVISFNNCWKSGSTSTHDPGFFFIPFPPPQFPPTPTDWPGDRSLDQSANPFPWPPAQERVVEI